MLKNTFLFFQVDLRFKLKIQFLENNLDLAYRMGGRFFCQFISTGPNFMNEFKQFSPVEMVQSYAKFNSVVQSLAARYAKVSFAISCFSK